MKNLRNRFFRAMKKRTDEKSDQGWAGWDCEEYRTSMRHGINANIKQGNWVDAANLIMFVWGIDKESKRGGR